MDTRTLDSLPLLQRASIVYRFGLPSRRTASPASSTLPSSPASPWSLQQRQPPRSSGRPCRWGLGAPVSYRLTRRARRRAWAEVE